MNSFTQAKWRQLTWNFRVSSENHFFSTDADCYWLKFGHEPSHMARILTSWSIPNHMTQSASCRSSVEGCIQGQVRLLGSNVYYFLDASLMPYWICVQDCELFKVEWVLCLFPVSTHGRGFSLFLLSFWEVFLSHQSVRPDHAF